MARQEFRTRRSLRLGALIAVVVLVDATCLLPGTDPTVAIASPADGNPGLTPVDGKDALSIIQGDPNDSWYGSLPDNYSQKEYFLHGSARTYPTETGDVPAQFNGTVVVEWLHNVGAAAPNYPMLAPEIHRRGYAWVGVSVHVSSIDFLQATNPLRYETLLHPGEEYRFDMFSQAGYVLRNSGSHDALAGLRGHPGIRLIGTAVAGNGTALDSYIETGALRDANEDAVIYDALLLESGGRVSYNADGSNVDVPSVPVIHVRPESQAIPPPSLGGAVRYVAALYRLWWLAGSSHRDWYQTGRQLMRVGTPLPVRPVGDLSNDWLDGSYGDLPASGGPCPRNFFPKRYAVAAALRALDVWVRTSQPAPPSSAEFEYDDTGELARDGDLNVIGGLRLAPIEVPVAGYVGNACDQFGMTIPFTDLELRSRYPTHDDYATQLTQAVEANVDDGFLLREDADDLLRRADAIWFRWGVVQP